MSPKETNNSLQLMVCFVLFTYYSWVTYSNICCPPPPGEDLNSKARSKYQQEQLREWSIEQQREREQARRNQEQADRLYELKMRELDQRSMDLQKAEEECRRNINMATTDYNNALVRP